MTPCAGHGRPVVIYQQDFFNFLDECVDYANVVWGEDGYDKEYLEDVCLDLYRYREKWDFVQVLHEVRKQKERKKNGNKKS